MEPLKLYIFQSQILLQCDYALKANREFESALSQPSPLLQDIFYHAQTMLLSYSNISKLLWGQADGPSRTERLDLRTSLGVGKNSFSQLDRKMRNHYEHIDERLDEWWSKSDSLKRRYMDMNMGPIDDFRNLSATDKNILRHYDPVARKLRFWGDEWNIDDFIAEVTDLRRRADEALKSLPLSEILRP